VCVQEVARVDVGRLWDAQFPEGRVDLCKIDIEGFEVEFLEGNPAFMSKVDRILLEWHKPHVTLDRVKSAMAKNGHWALDVLHEDARFGVLWGSRVQFGKGTV